MSAPQRPQPTPEQLPGRIHTHEVDGARQRMFGWITVFVVLGAAYAYLVFLRMKEIAERLPGWPRGFPTGAAVLFTGLSLFALGLLVVWAMRPSRLMEALHSTGQISAETHSKIAGLGQAADGFSEQSRTLTDAAGDELNQGTRWRDVGKEKVIRVAQKAAVLAGVKRLVVPDASNLGPFHQDERDHAESYLHTAAGHRDTTAQLLDTSPDWTVHTPLANPWAIRSEDRATAPNPEYIDRARLSGPAKRGMSTAVKVLMALLLIALITLITLAVVAATRASATTPATSVQGWTSAAPPPGSAPAASTYPYVDQIGGRALGREPRIRESRS